MTRTALLALPLLLAACGGPGTPAEPDRPEFAACREEARASAPVTDVGREMNVTDRNHMDRLRERGREAENRAYADCLRRRGLIRGGGVEPVRRPGSIF